jgi:hypothetical protein
MTINNESLEAAMLCLVHRETINTGKVYVWNTVGC